MAAPKRLYPIGFRPRPAELDLVDRAAEVSGINRSEFIKEAALTEARRRLEAAGPAAH